SLSHEREEFVCKPRPQAPTGFRSRGRTSHRWLTDSASEGGWRMSKVVVAMFVTLDGVMEDPGGGEGFQHGGWQLPLFDQDMADGVRDGLFAGGALLLGRVTYQHFAAAWPSMTDEEGFADRMNSLPKYVASTTLQEPLAWNATLLTGDVAEAVAKLKQQPGGDLLVQGSGQLARTLPRD